MIKICSRLRLFIGSGALLVASALFAAEVGQAAPDFSLTDLNNEVVSLASFKGKTVVLEWVNPDCPFVKKHYDKSGNIPGLQKKATDGGVVWLLINSATSGGQGDYAPEAAKAWLVKNQAAASHYLRDSELKVATLYAAKTTPHLFVINPQGVLVYAGAIDSIRSAKATDIAQADNYVSAALTALDAGTEIAKPVTVPYGCSVKY